VTEKDLFGVIRVIAPEVPIFSKFFRFFDIPNRSYELSKDKCFREKDVFLHWWISFCFCLL